MKVGINPATELKEQSIKQNRQFSDVLLQFIQESLLAKIYNSKYKEDIWIKDCFPWERNEEKIYMYFRKKKEQAGNREYIEKVFDKILSEDEEIEWQYKIRGDESAVVVGIEAAYKQMNIPMTLVLEEITICDISPEKRSFRLMLRQVKHIDCYIFKPESKIIDSLYEIVEKLELIGDMESYAIINQVLKTDSVSGRRVMEGLSDKASHAPKVLREKRISQIESYKTYSYMKKRWEKYCKNHNNLRDSWEDVVERVVSFLGPIWKALCRNEIFFDDWMPELGRFLG